MENRTGLSSRLGGLPSPCTLVALQEGEGGWFYRSSQKDLESARAESKTKGLGFGEVSSPYPGVTCGETADPDGNPVVFKPFR